MPDYDGPERRKNPSSNDWDWRRELQNEWDADRRRRGTHRRDKSAEEPNSRRTCSMTFPRAFVSMNGSPAVDPLSWTVRVSAESRIGTRLVAFCKRSAPVSAIATIIRVALGRQSEPADPRARGRCCCRGIASGRPRLAENWTSCCRLLSSPVIRRLSYQAVTHIGSRALLKGVKGCITIDLHGFDRASS